MALDRNRTAWNMFDRPKKKPKAPPAVLDSESLKQLLDGAANTRLYPLLVLAAATGCRRGELLALTWSDLNIRGTLIVSKSLEETCNGLRVKSTKSNKTRIEPVPASALVVLRQHCAHQANDRQMFCPDYKDHDLILCRPDGEYYCPDQMSVRVTALTRKLGLKGSGCTRFVTATRAS